MGTAARETGFLASRLRENPMLERLIKGPQGRLNLSEQPDGRLVPALFMHSDGGNLHHWDRIRDGLKDRPTAAFDRRGHGRSDFPASGSFAIGDAASDIAAVADELGYERFFLIGHSGGALVSFAYASQEPDRLLGLVLVDPPPDPAILPRGMLDEQIEAMKKLNYWATVEAYYRSLAGGDQRVVDRVLADAKATSKETMIGVTEAMSRFRPAEFTGYDGPALSIIQPQYDVDGALHRIAKMEHVAIDGAGHYIHLAAPARFLDALEDFFEDYEKPGKDGVKAQADRRPGAAD
jgi:pimeloyl-ACP methyl ester carboxylesterase